MQMVKLADTARWQAARVSQHTAFFHLGGLLESAPTEEIFTNPQNERTRDYITGRFG